MKQIKTIHSGVPYDFDEKVNAALADGWTLTNRYLSPHGAGFIAEMEKEVVTEAERCCENCIHFENASTLEPCASCSEDCNKWEAWR